MLTEQFPYFFAPEHAGLEARARDFVAAGSIADRVAALGAAGLLARRDTRSLAVARRQLAYRDPLTDLAFVIQELGCTPLESAAVLPEVVADARAGRRVLAFGLTEPGAGSDVRAVATAAVETAGGWRLTGTKHFISNAPDCDGAVVFARAPTGVAAFFVEAPATEAQRVASHSIGRLVLDDTPATLVSPRGFALAFGTLERCRPSVGAAAVGLAARALDETLAHVRRRQQFGAPLADLPVVRLRLAEMKNELDIAALATLHACWTRDHAQGARVGPVMAFGKVVATEAAQRVIDTAVQLHGGQGVEEGSVVEMLYRAVRPLRIYEGATDVLLGVIGDQLAQLVPEVKG
ncbi:MAG: acyl-CoA dehydrogenase [Deltaproteobacteria bacterium]|nr:acyl-CoA dehydrogenase [Deltaproteobacteria bacterium]